mmetsp:Transcript_32685/g.60783  ORF Transcript_32685/g.60783 Transcript_32685/m.60783 type:complete len:366 (-) Transcript_32685:292-1389(-)|eukprot:CAMPEP_0170179198 /NCGR_PEP_ID=MMETSP0040_2-20121228/16696_1 /TAXON_ID=641309 /ORGANISM="Lotharella oceanica, Strain CCMP622" /LENGTH=365 /DNA_ID=CAMNT_0010423105 /DNA_START=197 /DNA_END=1294 /DNA_ORIENTATION=+
MYRGFHFPRFMRRIRPEATRRLSRKFSQFNNGGPMMTLTKPMPIYQDGYLRRSLEDRNARLQLTATFEAKEVEDSSNPWAEDDIGAIKAVTFDFTGTLAQVKGSTEEHYLDELKAVVLADYGHKTWAEVDEASIRPRLLKAFYSAYKARMRELPNFGYGKIESEEWWDWVIVETFKSAGVPQTILERVHKRVGERLYDRFATNSAWELYPEVPDLIRSLNSSGIILGVVSNFDSRLEPILESLGILKYFRFVLASGELGIEKPSAEIYEEAMKLAGCDTFEEILHVGDTVKTDVLGPLDMGMPFIFVDRHNQDSPQLVPVEELLKSRGVYDKLVMRTNTVANLSELADQFDETYITHKEPQPPRE